MSANDEFPVWALLPKRETNVSTFLNKYPEFDGRGVRIAILDSGVDVAAKGLQFTSDGKRKIIEMMDASGSGDVDTSTVVSAEDGYIKGLTGRKLKIPSTWENPTGKYHIGMKNAFELYPKQLKNRIIKERKEKYWDPTHKPVIAEACRKLQEFTNQNPNTAQLSHTQKLQKEELEAQLDVLNNIEKKFVDVGPTYDCVVFHDGKQWKVVIDTSECGDLESCTVLGPYSETYEYTTLTEADNFNYCVNVHEDGNLLEIVGNCSCHGTHVASIAAAYFPDEPDKNGVAPGAQIVSVTIGDIRLDTMETGSAFIRALIKVVNSHCDIINVSYGEPASWPSGRVLQIFHEVVDRHGIIVVTSAGNNGPALTTVGSPADMRYSSVISVGAYVSPDMMLAEYSLRNKAPGLGYTWTSRGPGLNGDLDVSICAPGGAITSVPTWTLIDCQLKNGTSMSSPNAAGCIAVLLSGLLAKNIPYSPYSVRRAIENTAMKVSTWDAFSMGHGLIQVDRAFDHLLQYSNCVERNVRFSITTTPDHKHGIYLREAHLTCNPSVIAITVEPVLLGGPMADAQSKLKFTMNLKLTCEAPWVFVPEHLSMAYDSRAFTVKVDPCGLPVGEHFTWIKAYDSSCIEKGPVFHIPVTVIISQKFASVSKNVTSCALEPGNIVREFIQVPAGATCAAVRLKSTDPVKKCSILLHAIQLRPLMSHRTIQYRKFIRIGPQEDFYCVFPVKEKLVLEVVFALWWASQESVVIDYNITFKGLLSDSSNIVMHGGDGIHRVDVHSSLSYEEMLPSVNLKSHVIPVRPSESKISPLKIRDVIPDGRQIYEIQLTYSFNIPKSSDVSPNLSLLSELLYESEFESQLWMCYDGCRQLLGSGDAFPNRYSVKLEKGDYTLKVQIRHEDRSLLEKLSDVTVLIGIKLSTSLAMDVYDKYSHALINGKKICATNLAPGSTCPLFIVPIPNDKLPKGSQPGHYLMGTMSFFKDENIKKAVSVNFKYVISELPKKSSSSKSGEKEKTLEEEFAEEIKQLRVSWLSKLTGEACKDLLEQSLAKETNPENRWAFLLSRLQSLDKEYEKIEDQDQKCQHLLQILKFADEILTGINQSDVLASLGSKSDKKDSSVSKKTDAQKSLIIETLVRKGKAMCDMWSLKGKTLEPDGTKKEEEPKSTGDGASDDKTTYEDITIDQIDSLYTELQKWVDISDLKVSSFTEKYSVTRTFYGKAVKILFKVLDDKKALETEQKCIEYFRNLGWEHCASHLERCLYVRYPPSYRLF